MRNFFVLLFLFIAVDGMAAVERRSLDFKLPSQQMIEKQSLDNVVAAGTTNVVNAHVGPTSTAATSITSFVAQPDVPRNLVITPGSTAADVASCVVTVSGKNLLNSTISETFTIADNQSTATTGNKAFKTVTSVAFPVSCEEGAYSASWSVGYGEKLGLKRCMDSAGHYMFSTVAGAYESTRATIAVNNSNVESNTADFNGTMNGSNDFEIFFLQNFRCNP